MDGWMVVMEKKVVVVMEIVMVMVMGRRGGWEVREPSSPSLL